MDRVDLITRRFTEHFEDIGAVPIPKTLTEWEEVEPRTNLRISLGFRRPTPDTDGVAIFCPELVARQTEHLDDDELTQYLDAVQWTVDLETTLYEHDLEEATQMADAALAEKAPGSLRLLTEVQMAWLDRSSG